MAGQASAAAADHTTGLQAAGNKCLVHYTISVSSTLDAIGRELLQASRTFSWDRLLRNPIPITCCLTQDMCFFFAGLDACLKSLLSS